MTRFPMPLALVIAVAIGAVVAFQARVNGELGVRLGDGFTAAAISFGGGLVVVSIGILLSRAGRRGLAAVAGSVKRREIPWWTVLGGCAGAFMVLSQGLTAAVLGVALFTVAAVAGQTASGLVLDRTGFGPGGVVAFTTQRVLGAAVSLLAVVIAVSGEFGGSIPLGLLVLPFLAGIGIAWQQAVNGRVKVRAQSTLAATFINFVVGTVVLVVAALVHAVVVSPPGPLPGEWWLYLGGPIGCVFIAVGAFLVQHTGVLILGLGTVAGQTLSALAFDLLLPEDEGGVHLATVVGTLLTVAAVAIASIRFRRRTGDATDA